MIQLLFKRYFSIIFMLATLMGVFHHHNDAKQHADCKICVVQSSIADADTPAEVTYLQKILLHYDVPVSPLYSLHVNETNRGISERAPPFSL